MVKELRAKCQINKSNNVGNKYNGLTYEYLLKQNKELINENNNLKEEYNLLYYKYVRNCFLREGDKNFRAII